MGRPRKRPRLRQHPPTLPPLPLDLVVEIAGRTDPETLVRCAAACKDLRRRICDDTAGFRLRLRHGDRFVPSLLRGHLVQDKDEVKCVPAAGADDVIAKPLFPTLQGRLLAARDGLLLLAPRATTQRADEAGLRVYSSATGRHQTLPLCIFYPEITWWHSGGHVLLTGDGDDGAVGRSFRVLNVQVTMLSYNHDRYMTLDTFSSEHGVWDRTTIMSPTTVRHSNAPMSLLGKPFVFRDAVHWLASRDNEYRIVTLHLGAAGAAAWLTSSPELPKSFPGRHCQSDQFLLAAGTRSRALAVLVAEANKIRAWSRSESTGEWRKRPQLVIRNTAIDTSWRVRGNVRLRARSLSLERFHPD